MREQNRIRVKRCREKQKLNAEGQIVKTPFNDRTNIQQSAVNTPNVGGKLGQQGYHSGNVVSQQGRKRKKEQNAGERSATKYSKQRKLFEQLDDNQKAAIRERNRVYVAGYCTRAMTKQIVIDQDDMETSPNDTPMSAIDNPVDDLEKPPNDTPMSVVNDPAIDSEEEFDEFEASTIPITDSIEDEVFYSARDVSYKLYRVDKSNIGVDQRRYNVPTVSQVAAIWEEGADAKKKFQMSIMVCGISDQQKYIQAYHGCYDPLSYPLFFPRSEAGWNKKILYADQGDAAEDTSSTIEMEDEDGIVDDVVDDDADETVEKGGGSRIYVSAREYYCYKL